VPERPIIIDTGPLVAPFLTCEPVLTEAYHLLSRAREGPRQFFQLLSRGVLKVDFEVMAEASALEKMIRKYQDLPMSLADACLVRLAERHPSAMVLKLDRHFKIYRKHGRQPIPATMPGE
jgi:predicted nucleic acid-binding protein